jgi:hypothetical protein
MTLFCTSIKGSVGLQPIGPIAPNWAPYLGGPELELSSWYKYIYDVILYKY